MDTHLLNVGEIVGGYPHPLKVVEIADGSPTAGTWELPGHIFSPIFWVPSSS